MDEGNEGSDHIGLAARAPDGAPVPKPGDVLRRLDEHAEALTDYRRRRGRQVVLATAALLGAVIGGILIGRRLWRRPRSRLRRVAQAMKGMVDRARGVTVPRPAASKRFAVAAGTALVARAVRRLASRSISVPGA